MMMRRSLDTKHFRTRRATVLLIAALVAVSGVAAGLVGSGAIKGAVHPAAPALTGSASSASSTVSALIAAKDSSEATSVHASPSVPRVPVDTRTLIVRAKPGADVAAVVGKVRPVNGNYLLRVPADSTTASFTAQLTASGDFAYATPDQVSYPLGYTATPNDPDFVSSTKYSLGVAGTVPYAKSWWVSGHGGLGNTASPGFDVVWPHLTADGATVAYDARAAAAQVKVGVIDTGYYFDTPDTGSNIVAGKDEFQTYDNGVYTTDTDVTPAVGGADADHGTMVASEIAQSTNNGVGGAAAGYDTQVRVYKVQGTWVDGSPANQVVMLDSAVVNAIYDATNDGCRVITMSLGSSEYDPAEQTAINYAYSKGVVVCAASGNDSGLGVEYPAADNHVLGVGSYDLGSYGTGTPTASSFNSYGPGLDILAPGDYVWGPTESTPGHPGYSWWAGTSMASPLAAAAAALTLRMVPSLGPDDVVSVLEASARDLGTAGYDTTNGWGRLDMAAAYAKLCSDYPNLAAPVVSGIASGASYTGHDFTLSWPAVPGYAVSYGVSIDGAAPTTSTATAASLASLANGAHTVTVAATSLRNWCAGSTATVTFTVDSSDSVAPSAPTVTWDSAARTVRWTASEAGSVTQLALDDPSAPTTVTGTSWPVPAATAYGTHTVYVRMMDTSGNIGAWGSVTFTLIEPGSRASALSFASPPSLTLAWGASATLSGVLADTNGPGVSGDSVSVQISTNGGGSWSNLCTATTAANGSWSASFVPGRSELVRASFAGDATYAAVISGTTVSVIQRISLGIPSTPGRATRARAFTTYTYVKPRFASGTSPVKMYFYRWEKRTGKYVWALHKTVSAKAANYSSFTKCSVSASVPYSGKWKVVARFAGSATYAATVSGNRYFTAK
jgi:hypothetical protein